MHGRHFIQSCSLSSGMDTAVGLVGNAISVVQAILKAREEIQDAPKKVVELVVQVENAGRLLERVQGMLTKVEDAETLKSLHPTLQQLGQELEAAQLKVERYKHKSGAESLLSGIKTVFGYGAATQNRKVADISKRIQDALLQLNHALSAEVFGKFFVSSNGSKYIVVPSKFLGQLEEFHIASLDSEDFSVSLEIGGVEGSVFHAPQPGLDVKLRSDGESRVARDGGYEVQNSSKLRFEISVEEDRFFYVVAYDPEEGDPVLFHPKLSSADNVVRSKFSRVFPDPVKHKHDPKSFRIEKSGSKRVGQQVVFFILPPTKLHEARPARNLKLEDIQEKLQGLSSETFVQKFDFDILG